MKSGAETKRDLIVVGGGGHGKSIVRLAAAMGAYRIKGVVDPNIPASERVAGQHVLGGDDVLEKVEHRSALLTIGVGTVRSDHLRKDLFNRFRGMGYSYAVLKHPSAILAEGVVLSDGSQIMAGAIVQTDAFIGENAIINTAAVIEHDCRIGSHCHVATGAVLGGGVVVGECSMVGMGARVLPGVKVGCRATIGAGAVVVTDVPDDDTVAGVPARSIT